MNPTTPAPAPLQKSHPCQSDLNLALLNFVNQRGQASWAELFAAFGEGDASATTDARRFSCKLEYLTLTQRLQHTGRARSRIFSIGPLAGKAATLRGRTTTKVGQADGSDTARPYPHLQHLGAVVPARLHVATGTYVPPTQTAMRPGALDYKRHASHGFPC